MKLILLGLILYSIGCSTTSQKDYYWDACKNAYKQRHLEASNDEAELWCADVLNERTIKLLRSK